MQPLLVMAPGTDSKDISKILNIKELFYTIFFAYPQCYPLLERILSGVIGPEEWIGRLAKKLLNLSAIWGAGARSHDGIN